MDTVVLIPAYKPDMRLATLAEGLCGEYKVLIIDDGGGADFDGVFEACLPFAKVLRYPVNKGKGGAMKYGFSHVRELFPEAKYVVTADADGQHTREDIGKVATKLRESSGLVLGSRAFSGDVPARSIFGNTVTRWVFALLSGKKVGDTQTGLRGFSVEYLDEFSVLKGDRYEYEMTMLMYAAEQKIPISEVEIETIYENNNECSHFNPIKDSARIYFTILKCSTMLKYVISSVTAFVIEFVLLFILTDLIFKDALHFEPFEIGAWIVSSFTNFTLNRSWVFKSKKSFIKSGAEYYGLALVSFGIKLLIMEPLIRLLFVPDEIALVIATMVMYVINYIVQKKFIFKKKNKHK